MKPHIEARRYVKDAVPYTMGELPAFDKSDAFFLRTTVKPSRKRTRYKIVYMTMPSLMNVSEGIFCEFFLTEFVVNDPCVVQGRGQFYDFKK